MEKYYFLYDKNISLKAKALLAIMLEIKRTKGISMDIIKSFCKESDSSIRNAIKELKDNDYLVVSKFMPDATTSGRIEYEYVIKLQQTSY